MERAGVRAEWSEVPGHIRRDVDALVGAHVTTARNIAGGFSPGPAARCDLDDGRTVFVKAAGSELNPFTPDMHRQEALILAMLPSEVPAPRLIGVVDDGNWVALVIEWIDAVMPSAPMTDATASRVIRLAERLAACDLGSRRAEFDSVVTAHPGLFGHWQHVVDHPVDGLDSWTADHLDKLVRLEAMAPGAVEGDHLVHLDLRTDNVLLGVSPADDVVVDWPSACRGAPWIDLVALLPSLHLDGGRTPEATLQASTVSVDADPSAVDAFIAAMAGYFTRMSLMAPPPGLPTLRPFQAAQGEVARTWLRQRLEQRELTGATSVD